MSKALQINIAEPCHENWQHMTPNEQGRFCGSCQKTVIDFTTLTDKEILEYISMASHNICGRLNSDQMNRDIKEMTKKRQFSFACVWNLVLATFLLTKADAQVGKVAAKKTPVTKVPERPKLLGEIAMMEPHDYSPPVQAKGIVVNAADGTPMQGVSVLVKDKQTGTATDSTGAFHLALQLEGPVELVVSSIGYETQTVIVDHKNVQQLKVALQAHAAALDTVAVTGYPSVGRISFLGGIGYSVRVSRMEKAKRTISDWMPKKEMKVYPNPTTRGVAINVSLALKQAGQYRMELLDASGRIVYAQLLQMPETARTVQVPTSSTWSAGVYWLKISGRHTKHVYQNKVIIQ